jgi:hypothetical protein
LFDGAEKTIRLERTANDLSLRNALVMRSLLNEGFRICIDPNLQAGRHFHSPRASLAGPERAHKGVFLTFFGTTL